MKKILIVGILIIAILASVVVGTLAVYNAELDEMSGDVLAKEFVFDAVKVENFDSIIKIAPTEKVYFQFYITNTKNNVTTEVPLDVELDISLRAKSGKTAIGNLSCKVLDEDKNFIAAVPLEQGFGNVVIESFMGITEESRTFIIEVEWVENLIAPDMDYMGNDYGSTIAVNASAVQCTHQSHDVVVDEDDDDEEVLSRRSENDAKEYVAKLIKNMYSGGNKNLFKGNFGIYRTDGAEDANNYAVGSEQYSFFANKIQVAEGDEIIVQVFQNKNAYSTYVTYYGDGYSFTSCCTNNNGGNVDLIR